MLSVAIALFCVGLCLRCEGATIFLLSIVLAFNFLYAPKPRKRVVFFVKGTGLKFFFQEMGRLDIYRNIQLVCYVLTTALGICGLIWL
jgi:hypothetical protein